MLEVVDETLREAGRRPCRASRFRGDRAVLGSTRGDPGCSYSLLGRIPSAAQSPSRVLLHSTCSVLSRERKTTTWICRCHRDWRGRSLCHQHPSRQRRRPRSRTGWYVTVANIGDAMERLSAQSGPFGGRKPGRPGLHDRGRWRRQRGHPCASASERRRRVVYLTIVFSR